MINELYAELKEKEIQLVGEEMKTDQLMISVSKVLIMLYTISCLLFDIISSHNYFYI